MVNDEGALYPPVFPNTNVDECDYSNNVFILHIDNPRHNLDLGPDIVKCSNEVFTLNAGSGFETYAWTDFTSDSIYSSDVAGRHLLTATDRCGNVYTDEINVIISTAPEINLGRDTVVCQMEPLFYNLPSSFLNICLLYTSPSPRDQRGSRMPSSA